MKKTQKKAHFLRSVGDVWQQVKKAACGRPGLATGDPDAFGLPVNGPFCKSCVQFCLRGRA